MDAVSYSEGLFKNSTLAAFTRDLIKRSLCFTRNSRVCTDIPDEEFVFMGMCRVLSQSVSGRDFLQFMLNEGVAPIKTSTYFESMKSERRLKMLRDVSAAFSLHLNNELISNGVDYLGDFPELAGRPVVAGDGHTIEHAAHARRDKKGRLVPVSNIHLLNLHTGIGLHFTDVQGDGSRRHEIKAFRDLVYKAQGLPLPDSNPTKRPILIYDRAIVDKIFWSRQKLMKVNGIDVITRKKESMKFLLQMPRMFNSDLDINKGVIKDYTVGADNAVSMRLIVYLNSEDGKTYEFLTTIEDLEPGLIAWLYLLRWKIEKMFDTFKNKLQEKKEWANGKTAQETQSRFCHMTRNLLVYIQHLLGVSFDITEKKLEKKRQGSLKKRVDKEAKKGKLLHPQCFSKRYLFQLSCQFIRAVRNLFFKEKTIMQMIRFFRGAMTAYY